VAWGLALSIKIKAMVWAEKSTELLLFAA